VRCMAVISIQPVLEPSCEVQTKINVQFYPFIGIRAFAQV
jgi:hypothetical protein